MELKKADLTNRIHKTSLLEKIHADPDHFDKLLNWSFLKEQPIGWRATWLLKQVVDKNDPRLGHQISQLIEQFPKFNESQKREWLRILIYQEFTDDDAGYLFDLCMLEWKNIHNHPALRSSAFQILMRIFKKFPELVTELTHLMTPEYLEPLSPAIRKGILKQWNSL